jgi:hypothetical protein
VAAISFMARFLMTTVWKQAELASGIGYRWPRRNS